MKTTSIRDPLQNHENDELDRHFCDALLEGNVRKVTELLLARGNPNLTTPSGQTPLTLALTASKVDVARTSQLLSLLIDAKADVNQTIPANCCFEERLGVVLTVPKHSSGQTFSTHPPTTSPSPQTPANLLTSPIISNHPLQPSTQHPLNVYPDRVSPLLLAIYNEPQDGVYEYFARTEHLPSPIHLLLADGARVDNGVVWSGSRTSDISASHRYQAHYGGQPALPQVPNHALQNLDLENQPNPLNVSRKWISCLALAAEMGSSNTTELLLQYTSLARPLHRRQDQQVGQPIVVDEFSTGFASRDPAMHGEGSGTEPCVANNPEDEAVTTLMRFAMSGHNDAMETLLTAMCKICRVDKRNIGVSKTTTRARSLNSQSQKPGNLQNGKYPRPENMNSDHASPTAPEAVPDDAEYVLSSESDEEEGCLEEEEGIIIPASLSLTQKDSSPVETQTGSENAILQKKIMVQVARNLIDKLREHKTAEQPLREERKQKQVSLSPSLTDLHRSVKSGSRDAVDAAAESSEEEGLILEYVDSSDDDIQLHHQPLSPGNTIKSPKPSTQRPNFQAESLKTQSPLRNTHLPPFIYRSSDARSPQSSPTSAMTPTSPTKPAPSHQSSREPLSHAITPLSRLQMPLTPANYASDVKSPYTHYSRRATPAAREHTIVETNTLTSPSRTRFFSSTELSSGAPTICITDDVAEVRVPSTLSQRNRAPADTPTRYVNSRFRSWQIAGMSGSSSVLHGRAAPADATADPHVHM